MPAPSAPAWPDLAVERDDDNDDNDEDAFKRAFDPAFDPLRARARVVDDAMVNVAGRSGRARDADVDDADVDVDVDDGDDDDDAWITFAEDVAAPARDEAEAAVRDVAFEEALARVRAGRRALARRAAERATRRGDFFEEELKLAREEAREVEAEVGDAGEAGERGEEAEDAEAEDAGTSPAGWRGEFSAFDGDPAPAPKALPHAWTMPTMDVDLERAPSDEVRRDIAARAMRASVAAEEARRESDAVAEMSQQIRRLNAALSACERRESAAELAATSEAERAAALEHQCLEVKARLKARDADIGELNKVMFVLKKRADDLTDALDEARRDGEKYRMEIAELKVNDSELRRTVEKRAISERMAYNSHEQTRRDIIALQSKCRALQEENERLSERLTQSEENCFESSKSAQRFHQLAEASARETEILQRANDVAANENKELRRELNELQKQMREIRAQTNKARPTTAPVTTSTHAPSMTSTHEPVTTASPVAPVASDAPHTVLTPLNAEPVAPVARPTSKGRSMSRENASEPVVSASRPPQHFDDSEYKRRMRDGSGFFYDMRGVDPPKPKSKPRPAPPARPLPGDRYVPPVVHARPTASYDEWIASIATLEKEHMQLALERDALEARLRALPSGAGRTMLERERKAGALERLDIVREALRKNRLALAAVKESR